MENILFTVDAKELKGVTDTPKSHLVDLVLDNGQKFFAILHELQFHPVSDACLHVDFLAVDPEKPVAINVPVAISGHSVGVQQGGKFVPGVRTLKVCGLMDKLPDEIPVDITNLKLDKSIRAADLDFEGFSIVSNKSTIICSVKTTRNTVAAAAEETEA